MRLLRLDRLESVLVSWWAEGQEELLWVEPLSIWAWQLAGLVES